LVFFFFNLGRVYDFIYKVSFSLLATAIGNLLYLKYIFNVSQIQIFNSIVYHYFKINKIIQQQKRLLDNPLQTESTALIALYAHYFDVITAVIII